MKMMDIIYQIMILDFFQNVMKIVYLARVVQFMMI